MINRMLTIGLALLASGCVGSANQPTGPESSGPPSEGPEIRSMEFFPSCTAIGGNFPLPGFFLESSLPPGFTLAETGPIATLQITAFKCTDASVEEFFMIGSWAVVPPAEYRHENISHYAMSDGGFVQGPRVESFFLETPWADWISAAAFEYKTDQQAGFLTGNVSATDNFGSNSISVALPILGSERVDPHSRIFIQDIGQATLIGFFDMGLTATLTSGGTAMELAQGGLETQGLPGSAHAYEGAELHLSNLTVLSEIPESLEGNRLPSTLLGHTR